MNQDWADFTIVYLGSPDFAVPALAALKEAGYNIPLVVSQPAKPKGRKGKLTPTAVAAWAESAGIPVITPERVNAPETISQIRALRPDILVVAAYGQILKPELLTLAPLGAVNIHASLLPKYRGAAPIQAAIMNGDKLSGVTTMHMAEGLDTGDMILRREVQIEADDDTGSLTKKLAASGAELILETIEALRDGKAPREAQDDTISSYAGKIRPEDEKLDFSRPAVEICNLIRALSPDIGAYALDESEAKIKIWSATVLNEVAAAKPGTLLRSDKTGLCFATGDQVLLIREIQSPGKSRMRAADWWRGKMNKYTDKIFALH